MRSHKFLAGAVTGVALVLLVTGLLLAGVGRQPTSAASGTPEASAKTSAATPTTTAGLSKDAVDTLEQRMITTISDEEWNAAATALGLSEPNFEAAINGGKSVASLGAARSVTVDRVRTTMVAAGESAVNAAVQSGTITQPDAATLNSGLVTAIAGKVTHANTDTGTAAGTPTVDEQALDAQKHAGAMPADDVNNAVAKAELSAMASTLSMTSDDLKTALSSTNGLATLDASHHVTAQQLDDAMVAAGQQALDRAVANGTVSQAEADSLRTGLVQLMAQKLSGMMNAPAPATPTP